MKKLSVVLATRNEAENIGRCLDSVKDIADEIIIFDEHSTDKTQEIAKSYGAKVFLESHHENFHITKQKAIEAANGEWILQLDADEVVTKELADEIEKVINLTSPEIRGRNIKDKNKLKLFDRHQRIIENRDGELGKQTGEIVAFFIARRNMFLGKPLIYGGVYPDAVIRLIKSGKARLPAKSVHEQMQIDGEVAWLFNDLEHHDSPTLKRYLERLNRYTNLHALDLEKQKVSKNIFQFVNYSIVKPKVTFIRLYFRHKGYKDGIRGFLWAMFSASHFPIAYYKYLTLGYNTK